MTDHTFWIITVSVCIAVDIAAVLAIVRAVRFNRALAKWLADHDR